MIRYTVNYMLRRDGWTNGCMDGWTIRWTCDQRGPWRIQIICFFYPTSLSTLSSLSFQREIMSHWMLQFNKPLKRKIWGNRRKGLYKEIKRWMVEQIRTMRKTWRDLAIACAFLLFHPWLRMSVIQLVCISVNFFIYLSISHLTVLVSDSFFVYFFVLFPSVWCGHQYLWTM